MLDVNLFESTFDPRQFNGQTTEQLLGFVHQTGMNTGNTEQERWLKVFSSLRPPLTETNWYASKELRSFLMDTMDVNPYIAPSIRSLDVQSKATHHTIESCLEDWRSVNPEYPIDPFHLNPDDFTKTINAVPGVAQRFAKGNLHNHDYYFQKYTEWYVSCWMCRLYGYKKILDIGSNSRMFGEVVTGIVPKAQVTLLDLAYRPGARKVSDRMVEIGADAGDMSMIPNNSMDYVCLHNAFEHFCEDSDTRCVQEIGRILRPGGRAVIIPFMMAPLYTILINPVACFFIHKNNYFERVVQDEFQSHGAQIKFTKGFVSPFARLYNAQQARKRVLAAAKNLDVCLFYISFEDVMSSPGNHDELIFGQQLRYDLFERSPYYFLEFVKRAVTE